MPMGATGPTPARLRLRPLVMSRTQPARCRLFSQSPTPDHTHFGIRVMLIHLMADAGLIILPVIFMFIPRVIRCSLLSVPPAWLFRFPRRKYDGGRICSFE